ncbi:rod shape-determining protein MreD [Clostridium fallax]|uniref:Rod shape-determining protein MreD n=1 Tax=Clostridium fallax TaxID=1533 RepID=A0A1M4VB48_9CLOT|nr:rod shape-determining protein MreD [Clostridium fallax]SHE66143.1 rod shape-determining protein MreD [Clostridium fallax]SQB05805.1 rod shape-determining protein MreD [Clostridium fallax]
MKRVVLALLCILFLIIDNSIMPFISIKGIYPSLLFTFAICFSIINGKSEAIIIGVYSGALQDLYFANGFGINCLTNLLLCYLAAFIGENIFRNKRLVPVLLVGGITVLKYILVFLIMKFINISVKVDFGMVIMGIYNMILAFFIYNWTYKLSNKESMKSQWKFNK